MNTLYYGDNLDVLRRHVSSESVDLVYLDPPFKSDQNYNVLFQEQDGSRSTSQIHAFEDTWHWDQAAASAFQEVVESGGQVSLAMQAFEKILGGSDMLAYLSMMAPRLVELKRVLKPTGSIYLHCDPTASHHLKLLLDSVFGQSQFQNEIIWRRATAKTQSYACFPNNHDSIFFYSGTGHTFNRQFQPLSDERIQKHYCYADPDGRRFSVTDLTGSGTRNGATGTPWRNFDPNSIQRHWCRPPEELDVLDAEGLIYWPPTKGAWPRLKRYLNETAGVQVDSIWDDVAPINARAMERLGYPTQKPEALLERIIKASSNEGDTVLDPFCGCGTAIAAAQKLCRQWIGIDITCLAISLIKHRLHSTYGDKTRETYSVVGEPVSVTDAASLAADDPYQFQWWALGLVNARPAEQKKGADRGIDGRIFFHDESESGKTKQIIISVKAGKTGPSHVRDLRGVSEREKAAIGLLVTMEEPTAPMRKEAACAGFYESPWGSKHPRIQILTVGELLDGKTIDAPPSRDIRTFKKAPKAKGKPTHKQPDLF